MAPRAGEYPRPASRSRRQRPAGVPAGGVRRPGGLMDRQTAVREIMTTDVLTFRSDDNVEHAMRSMVDRSVDAAPVVDEAGNLIGMLSNSDLIVQETELHFPTV